MLVQQQAEERAIAEKESMELRLSIQAKVDAMRLCAAEKAAAQKLTEEYRVLTQQAEERAIVEKRFMEIRQIIQATVDARLLKERVEAAAAAKEAAVLSNSTILRSDTGDALIDGACTRDTIPPC